MSASARAQEPKPATYVEHVAPILEQSCTYCHDAADPSGGFDASSYAGLLAGGAGGMVVSPGDPDGSRLVRLVTKQEKPVMPADGTELSPEAIATLRRWIADGALEVAGGPAPPRARGPRALASSSTAAVTTELPGPLPLAAPRATRAPSVLALTASPVAPLLAVAGHGAVLLYDTRPGAPDGGGEGLLGALEFGPGRVHTLRFSRDGRHLLAAGGEGASRGRLVLFSVDLGLRQVELDEPRDVALAADVREDLLQVATGGPARVVLVRDAELGQQVFRHEAHTDWVTALAWSPDGVLLASGDRAGAVQLRESDSGREYLDLEAHGSTVHALAWRRDGEQLVTAAASGHLRLFAAQDGKRTKEWEAHKGGALAVAWLPDGRLASTGRDGTVALWSADGKEERRLGPLPDAGLCVAVSADGTRLFAGDWTGRVHAWTLPTAPVGKPPAPAPATSSWLALAPDLEAERAAAQARLAEAVAGREAAMQAVDAARPAAEEVDRDARARHEAAVAALSSATLVEAAAQRAAERWDAEAELVAAHAAYGGSGPRIQAAIDAVGVALDTRGAAEARARDIASVARLAAAALDIADRRLDAARRALAEQDELAASLAAVSSAAAGAVDARAEALRLATPGERLDAARAAHLAAVDQRARLDALRLDVDRARDEARVALATAESDAATARDAAARAADPAIAQADVEVARAAEHDALAAHARAIAASGEAQDAFQRARARLRTLR